MAEVTNELIFEALKKIQADTAALRFSNQEIRTELVAIRGHLLAMQQDIHNIYGRLDSHEARLERIERRLELIEPARA